MDHTGPGRRQSLAESLSGIWSQCHCDPESDSLNISESPGPHACCVARCAPGPGPGQHPRAEGTAPARAWDKSPADSRIQ